MSISMGILSYEPRHRLAFPGTPELVSPSSSTYSSRPSEAAPVSPPPMSNYDLPATGELMPGKRLEGPHHRNRRDPSSQDTPPSQSQEYHHQQRQHHQQPPPQQKLPSFNSIFSSVPQACRSLRSPHAEDHHPSYSTSSSPLDRPHRSGTPPSEVPRSSSSSYFPSAAASRTAQRGPYEPSLEERNPFHSVPRTPFPGPLSPRSREPDQHHHHHGPDSRSDYVPNSSAAAGGPGSRSEADMGTRWPMRQGGGREQQQQQVQYGPPPHHHDMYPPSPLSLLGGGPPKHDQQDPRLAYSTGNHAVSTPTPSNNHGSSAGRDQPPTMPHHHHQSPHGPPAPLTPASSVISEGLPTKDGLGPKIWTGTHFLPRFVRAQEVPGEGMCYFYDDGSHCKTIIDGEAVNAHWGVTKAGKPRKRLAIACVTCREKKIKCDPDYPRCVQCEKFSRVCKFKNAPRGGHNNTTSPSTPPAESDELRRLVPAGGRPTTAEQQHQQRPGSNSSASVSPRSLIRPVSPELLNPAQPAKRAKMTYDPVPHHHPHPHLSQSHGQSHSQSQSPHLQQPPPLYRHHSASGSERTPLPLPLRLPLPTPVSQHHLPDPLIVGGKQGPSLMPWRRPELPRIHEDVHRRPWQSDPRPDARI